MSNVAENPPALRRARLASAGVFALHTLLPGLQESADFEREVVPALRAGAVLAGKEEKGRRARYEDGAIVRSFRERAATALLFERELQREQLGAHGGQARRIIFTLPALGEVLGACALTTPVQAETRSRRQ